MKHSLKKLLKENPYPICVTAPLSVIELVGWINQFTKKQIPITLRYVGGEKYELWRALTLVETQEVEQGEWTIRAGSFHRDECRKSVNY